jgi:hypothetical protein
VCMNQMDQPGWWRTIMMRYGALFAVIVASVLRAGSPEVTGEWSVVARLAADAHDAEPQRIELVCRFDQHDTDLAGSCRPASGPEGIPISGAAHDQLVEWSFDIAPNETAKKQRAIFRGTLGSDGSVITGTFEFGRSRGDFEAGKR